MSVKIYHNPRCSKSRLGLDTLMGKDADIEVVKYMSDTPFTVETLTALLQKMQAKPMQLIRTKEQVYKDEIKDKGMSDEELIVMMVKHPRLIQRPVVEMGDRAVLANPIEQLAQLF